MENQNTFTYELVENSDNIEEQIDENSGMSSSSDSEDSVHFIQDGHQSADKEEGNQDKPPASYIALISMAILSSTQKKMLLSEIYKWISERYPYFKLKDRSWRNSVRHNLSLNECFVKVGRSNSGKGSYWSIHPANVEDFSNGDFRRRRARRRVRKCEEMQSMEYTYQESVSEPALCKDKARMGDGYVPMTSTMVSLDVLSQMFGMENVTADVQQIKTTAPPRQFTESSVSAKSITFTEPTSNFMDNPVIAMMSPAFLALLSPTNSDTSPTKNHDLQQGSGQYSTCNNTLQYTPVTVNTGYSDILPQEIPDSFLSPLSLGSDFHW